VRSSRATSTKSTGASDGACIRGGGGRPQTPDRDLFNGKFSGRKYTSDYALRCNNEDQIIRSTEEILRLMGL